MLPAPYPPWRNPRLIVLLFLVFLAGSLAGALAMKLWRPGKVTRAQPTAWSDKTQAAILERFRNELDLNPQQTSKFEEILDDFAKYYHTLQNQMADVRTEGRNRMLEILTPQQKEKFKRMATELQEKLPR
jgi:hypothetical protein